MIHLRLAKEYMVSPVFCSDQENMGHVDLADLPISNNLRLEIAAWDDEYQGTFNSEYPPDSGFSDVEIEQAHMIKGGKLAEDLQSELGSGYSVEYRV